MYNKFAPTYEITEPMIPIESKGPATLYLGRVAWNGRAPKLELRKWGTKDSEEAQPQKGVVFMTKDGPHTLVLELIKAGYGDTSSILEELTKRKDFDDLTKKSNLEEICKTSQEVITKVKKAVNEGLDKANTTLIKGNRILDIINE